MTELNQFIIKILDKSRVWPSEMNAIKEFISKCSLTDFEKLKDLDYDENFNQEFPIQIQ
jgi:hypothetical protein